VGGYILARIAGSYSGTLQLPGALPAAGAAVVLMSAAVIASLTPAARAARVNLIQALRSE
jgi:ABC-type antimicrobial peptide transport system permease subunit